MKYFVYAIIAVVAATVIAGFFIVGSPQEERMRRFDDQRVSHLQIIQSEVVSYWINKGRLPAALSELEDDIRGFRAPTDPETGTEYAYSVTAPESFTLCATFVLSSSGTPSFGKPVPRPVEPYGEISQNWQHDAGNVCFERTIDPDYYKPVKR